MATRNIVPRADGEGSVGTSAKKWAKVFADAINEGANLGNNASLGYRQPSTAYAVGQIAYHASLPTGYYLECTTAGTTSAGDITPNSTIGGTVSDGTVTWTVMKNLPLSGGAMTGIESTIKKLSNDGVLNIFGGTSDGSGGCISLYGKSANIHQGGFVIGCGLGESGTYKYLHGLPSGLLTWGDYASESAPDLAGSAIVAKSLGVNGYIKYASGLILQWGMQNSPEHVNQVTVNLPISFSNSSYKVVTSLWDNNLTTISTTSTYQYTVNSFSINTVIATVASRIWIAIGY